jgi:hypothetical protein
MAQIAVLHEFLGVSAGAAAAFARPKNCRRKMAKISTVKRVSQSYTSVRHASWVQNGNGREMQSMIPESVVD